MRRARGQKGRMKVRAECDLYGHKNVQRCGFAGPHPNPLPQAGEGVNGAAAPR
jgi:hypothetical protein